ncbi:MAG: hypothetical protein U0360_05815 [Dehalococcoidia bacterium]
MALRRIAAVSTISTMNVDCPAAMSSCAPMRADAVDERHARAGCRDEGAALRQQHDQRRLPQVGRLAAHVRAGEHDHVGAGLRTRPEGEVVGDEGAARELLLDDGVAAPLDHQRAALGERGADPGRVDGRACERGGDIEAG